MKIYEIIIRESQLLSSEESHYVMADNFDEAITQAHKRLAKSQKEQDKDAYIESIVEQFELEVIK